MSACTRCTGRLAPRDLDKVEEKSKEGGRREGKSLYYSIFFFYY